MIDDGILYIVALVTALGCGIEAGVFFAFSTSVMNALGRIPAAEGIRAMQSINVAVINPWFLGALVGTAVGAAVLGVASVFMWDDGGAGYVLAASLVYLVGVILLTGGYHIPRNDALDAVDPESTDGQAYWRRYLIEWTRMNHVRTIAPLASLLLYILAFRTG